ncbi:E3 ubiquitin-protein ligase MIB2-like isoform X2 [Lytechinus variegatus]|uniref:E3 ubiquitin-protein ligase MIB2-like isoform X2 n=1 Tax=Lytechinus variegatus TaxID=7654 RepID=UPI001BB2B8D6|nr:E3 ubiquitin-protein ligase MIB2-like isoform X2 [Lytechinus variegatus]
MSRVIGTRIIRGPDWTWGNQDGGERHLGTIANVIPNDPDNDNGDEAPRVVKVTWDTGKKGNYRVGYEQKYDLRLYDNSTIGVLHKFVRCIGCASDNIAGIRWRCAECVHCDLCTECYMSDSHDTSHEFLRIDGPHDPGVVVKARDASNHVTSYGIFVGAKVSRGPDWSSGNEDAGPKSVGTVTDVCDWSMCFKNCGASVQWNDDATFKYRVGHNGKVEIKAIQSSEGHDYYEAHLPLIGESESWRKGEKVMVAMDTEMLSIFQEETGENWDNSVVEKLGQPGGVEAVDQRGWVEVIYDDKTKWTMPPFTLKKVINYKIGDRVRITANMDMIEDLHRKIKKINESIELSKMAGEEGRVVETEDSNGCVKVKVRGQSVRYHHAALTLLPKREGDDEELEEEPEVEEQEEEEEEKDEEKKIDEEYEIISNAPKVGSKAVPIPEPAGADDKEAVHRAMAKLKEKLKEATMSGLNLKLQDIVADAKSDEKQMVKAAAAGNIEAVKDFLKQNPKLANATHRARSALQVASHEGSLPIVQLLVDAHASLEHKDSDGDTALAFAVIGNNPSVAEFLLERKAYVNTSNGKRRTPLHICAHKEHLSCAEVLVKHGGSVNMQDNDGYLPIHLSIKQKAAKMWPLFVNHQSADLKLRTNAGFTPLHYAAKRNCLEVVKLMVAKDPSLALIEKDDGFTPLHVAAVNNHLEISRVLINLPATIDAGEGHSTPLHLATWQGYSELVELLVNHGAAINLKDTDGDTVLHLSIRRRKSGQKFVQDTPELQKVCKEVKETAITTPRDALIAYFIQHGSDVTIKNKNGHTPFELLDEEPLLLNALMRVAGIKPDKDLPEPEDEAKVHFDEKEEKREDKGKEQKRKEEKKKEVPKKKDHEQEEKACEEKRQKTQKKRGDKDFGGVHIISPDELNLGKTVGQGGFGEVKKAVWRGTTVAVKIISSAGSRDDEVEKEVFVHKRARHPNIVSLMAVGHRIGQALIVMEFIDGMDLNDVIFKKKKDGITLTKELKMSTTLGLLSALTYLHASKILHLDIKPSNVMMDRSSKRAYLCDLGLAHIKTRSSMSLSTSVGGPRGTISFMAPEMIQSQGKAWAGPGNDIWAIACTFLELFVEQRLWEGMEFMALFRTLMKSATPPPILKKAKSDVRTILKPCFEANPLKRPSAAVLLEQFQGLEKPSS